MSWQVTLGLLMLLSMLGVIFVGFPISFTLLFIALVFGVARPRPRPDLQPRLPADLGHDEGRHPARRAAVHLHGLHDGAGRADAAAVPGAPQPPRPGARGALPHRHPHRGDLRHGDGHRRRGRHRPRHHGRPGHGPGGVRRQALGRGDRRRRHARHPDPAERDARGHGADHGRAGEPALRGRHRAGLPARRDVRGLLPGPQLLQPGARPARAGRGAGDGRDGDRARGPGRRRPPGRADRLHARHHSGGARDRDGSRVLRRGRRDAAGAALRQAQPAIPEERGDRHPAHLQHGPFPRGELQRVRGGVHAARGLRPDRQRPARACRCPTWASCSS